LYFCTGVRVFQSTGTLRFREVFKLLPFLLFAIDSRAAVTTCNRPGPMCSRKIAIATLQNRHTYVTLHFGGSLAIANPIKFVTFIVRVQINCHQQSLGAEFRNQFLNFDARTY
jgi:hypothetical protein